MRTNTRIKKVDKNGFPKPLKVKCFQCKENDIEIKYVVPNKNWSKKNNWEYWTNPEAKNPEFWKDKEARKNDPQICNICIVEFYEDKENYWRIVTDSKRRAKLTTYIYEGKFSA